MMTHTSKLELRDEDRRGLRMLYPKLMQVSLTGRYLCEDLRSLVPESGAFVYSNFITSLDGRIAVAAPDTGRLGVPAQTANPRDWRLLLELAAPADVVVLSGRHVRELGEGTAQAWPPFSSDAPTDLLEFRQQQSLPSQPAVVIVTRSLDLPVPVLERLATARQVIIATDNEAPEAACAVAQRAGAEVLRLGERSIDGQRLISALTDRQLRLIYSTAGPAVLHLLLRARVLQRLYLTTVTRILGGVDYATLVLGERLAPPFDFTLAALYLDAHGPNGIEQLMQVYDRKDVAAPSQ
jgi:riboflavin biosynthesis pyrimidine reductase